MSNKEIRKTMRDVFIEGIIDQMAKDDKIFFLCADFGAPSLDRLRTNFPDRFINVGIAEQNLVNVAAGLALEGYTVFAYAIAPFITMRCFEQIRVNLAILSQVRPINVNLIGVGAGFSYEVSGPTHHCLEDIAVMRVFPNMTIVSPSDWVTAQSALKLAFENKSPKYFRFDAKPHNGIHENISDEEMKQGFIELKTGQEICIVSTGFMTHKAMDLIQKSKLPIGLIDLFLIKGLDKIKLAKLIQKYKKVITIEEGFINKGGMDSIIAEIIVSNQFSIKMKPMGLKDEYIFELGGREQLHSMNGVGEKDILREMEAI